MKRVVRLAYSFIHILSCAHSTDPDILSSLLLAYFDVAAFVALYEHVHTLTHTHISEHCLTRLSHASHRQRYTHFSLSLISSIRIHEKLGTRVKEIQETNVYVLVALFILFTASLYFGSSYCQLFFLLLFTLFYCRLRLMVCCCFFSFTLCQSFGDGKLHFRKDSTQLNVIHEIRSVLLYLREFFCLYRIDWRE